jgi:putative heme-binding domain-containing protein
LREKGDPARGEAIFRRKELSCFQCHAIGGAGSQVGPDFMSLGASAPVDYLVESVLVPDAKQKEGFVSMQVMTKSGDILSGVRVRQTEKELVLRDAARDEMIIPLNSIELKKEIGSIMPAGLADLLTDAEFLDLVRFLLGAREARPVRRDGRPGGPPLARPSIRPASSCPPTRPSPARFRPLADGDQRDQRRDAGHDPPQVQLDEGPRSPSTTSRWRSRTCSDLDLKLGFHVIKLEIGGAARTARGSASRWKSPPARRPRPRSSAGSDGGATVADPAGRRLVVRPLDLRLPSVDPPARRPPGIASNAYRGVDVGHAYSASHSGLRAGSSFARVPDLAESRPSNAAFIALLKVEGPGREASAMWFSTTTSARSDRIVPPVQHRRRARRSRFRASSILAGLAEPLRVGGGPPVIRTATFRILRIRTP